jgi:hypothetical protein
MKLDSFINEILSSNACDFLRFIETFSDNIRIYYLAADSARNVPYTVLYM